MTTINNQEQTIVAPLGQALQDARRAASLSVDEVAQQLNLGPQTVRDIEEALDGIIENKKYPAIYLRGYLANYAKLVALDNVEQFIEYQQLSVSQSKQKSLRSPMIIRPVKKCSKWLWLLFILIVVAGISFAVAQQTSLFTTEVISTSVTEIKASTADVLVSNDESVAEVKVNSAAPFSVQNVKSATAQQSAETSATDASISGSASVVETTIASKAVSTAEITSSLAADELSNEPKNLQDDLLIQKKKVADKEPLTDSQLQPAKKVQHNESLQLNFADECWTEIFDATGKRLAFNLYKKGALLTVHGHAPFKLKLGDPSVVAIQYQDKKLVREFAAGRTVTFSVPQKFLH